MRGQEAARRLRKGRTRTGQNQIRTDQIPQGFVRLLKPRPRNPYSAKRARPCRRPLRRTEYEAGDFSRCRLAHHRPLRTACRVPADERYRPPDDAEVQTKSPVTEKVLMVEHA